MKRTLARFVVAGIIAASGCSGSADNEHGSGTATTDAPKVGVTSEFVDGPPEGAVLGADGPRVILVDSSIAPPATPWTWVVRQNAEGCETVPDDRVTIDYSMAAWADGSIVEESSPEEPLILDANDDPIESGQPEPPAALRTALAGRRIGSRIGVIFPAGMSDLPDRFPSDSAYVLSVDIVESESCNHRVTSDDGEGG